VKSNWKTGRVQVRWRGDVRLDLSRLRSTVLAWRGGIRLAGIDILVTGTLIPWKDGVALRTDGPGRLFVLQASATLPLPEQGSRVRLVGEAALPEKVHAGADAVLTVREVERLAADLPRR
jgi:hypothetical protein